MTPLRKGMTNEERFFEAFGHGEHEVMGKRLRKFTLKHRFWLEALESPLVGGGEVSLMDLELAARVCAIPYPALDGRLPRMLTRGMRWWQVPGWMWRAMRRSTASELRAFHGYLLDHGCAPETFEEAAKVVGDGKVASVNPLPGLLALVTGVVRSTYWDPDTVWGLSPGEAEWYLAGVLTHKGVDVGLKSEADEAMEEFLKRRSQQPAVNGQQEREEPET